MKVQWRGSALAEHARSGRDHGFGGSGDGRLGDRGESYRTAIFVASDRQRRIALADKEEAAKLLAEPVVTPVLRASAFWPAEGYHQDYYKNNAVKYRFYRSRCGRDARPEQLWGGKG